VLAFAARVTFGVDPVADAEKHDNMGALVGVTTFDGRTFEERVRYSKGLPENPMSDAEFEAKFRELAEPLLGAERCGRIIAWVDDIEHHVDAGTVLPLLVR
jgi:2-methylcitrate dehydratase PrpD